MSRERKTYNSLLFAGVSGILSFVAICQLNFIVGLVCYVPLFMAMYNQSVKQVFKTACVFALVFSAAAFFWMIPSAKRFTGNSPIYGVVVFLLSSILYTLYSAFYLLVFTWLRRNVTANLHPVLQAMLAASIFCLAEGVLTFVSAGLPWFDVHSGNAFIKNIFAIQPAAFFGIHVMSFMVVATNYLVAATLFSKRWNSFWMPASLVAGYLGIGFLLFKFFNEQLPPRQPFKVAIVAENIPPEIKWDDANGNMLVSRLLNLTKEAAAAKPDLLLWSESAIPWTYNQDDDLLKAILEITDPRSISHILGMNTASDSNEVYNSAYSISPGGLTASRFDKQYLLSFVEKPVSGLSVPFLSSNGYTALSDKKFGSPLLTLKGKAGVLICNEAAIAAAAASQVRQGASYLVNLSNDGWFNQTYIMDIHFYYARLRAVETRKDIGINSNNGYSGLVTASGAIEVKERSTEAFVKLIEITPNNFKTLAVLSPHLFLWACLVFLIVLFFLKRIKAEKRYT